MSGIITNVPSLIAQRVVASQGSKLNTSLERLSTGYRINRGSDDPAGLIVSENLRSEKAAITAAINNAQRAELVVNVAEGGLQEINALLLEVQALVGQSANEAGVSDEEKEANRIQIDSILQTIDRIANSATFQGTKLLNGNYDYTVSNVASEVTDVSIRSANLSNTPGAYQDVTVEVTTSAQTGVVFISTTGTLSNGGNGSITIEVAGNTGVRQFTFSSGSTQANIINSINTFTEALGISATQSTDDANYVQINTRDFGSAEFVRVKVLEGTTDGILSKETPGTGASIDVKDTGRDAAVMVNGISAVADGLEATVSSDGFDLALTLDGASSLNTVGATTSFQITGGGANFNLAPKVNLSSKVSIGIETVTTGNLGNATVGFLSALKAGGSANVINGDLTKAQEIVDASIRQVSSLRGRLGAFTKNVVGSAIQSLGVTLENTAAAESKVRDTNFAEETAELTRRQIIQQAANQSLALANSAPQNVLSLLG